MRLRIRSVPPLWTATRERSCGPASAAEPKRRCRSRVRGRAHAGGEHPGKRRVRCAGIAARRSRTEPVHRCGPGERRTGRTGESGVVRTADGRVIIDLAAHVLEVEGEGRHLTPIEWKMLEVFVKNKGALVEAQTLLTEVWGPEFGTERGYLRVYMSQLRAKLEADPGRPQYLHTQMGIGYRFTP